MSDHTRDITDAAQLVAMGMQPKLIPDRDLDYKDLVRRYTADDDFAETVRAIAIGLDLRVLDVNTRSGIVLAPRLGSVFELKMDDYARRTALTNRGTDKVIHGLAHLAVAALAYPRPDDLANDSYVGYVSVEEVDAVVREACRVLEERAVAAEENLDPLDTAPDLERAWRAYARRPAGVLTKDGRLAPDSTRGIITKAVRYLADHGMLVLRNADGGAYRTTPKYQTMVRDAAGSAAFAELLDLGVIATANPSGTLRARIPATQHPTTGTGEQQILGDHGDV